jgi:hypothetical protein
VAGKEFSMATAAAVAFADDVPELAERPADRAPPWNPWLYAKGDRLRAVVAEVCAQALNAEKVIPQFHRKRARRPDDLHTFEAMIEALVAHVAAEHLRCNGAVRLSLDNNTLRRASRYTSELQSSTLPRVVSLLSTPELSFLNVTKGEKATGFTPGRQTTISAGPRLVSRLGGVSLDDVDRRPGEELILLKGLKDTETGTAELVEYTDNELTEGYRGEMRRLNAFLADADVSYIGDDPTVDDRDRFLRRRFTRGDFFSGGRVWGGFWQQMKKGDRLAHVLIDSEPVVSLDFQAMIVSLAYAYVGRPTPEGDPYTITFTGTDDAPVVLPRRIVKKIVAARLNGSKEWPSELREFRPGLSWRSVVETLKQRHAPIAPLFDLDMGQSLMFTESEVLTDALLNLADDGVVALPIHDCIVVAESDLDAARGALLDSFKFHTRQTARITVERAK